MIDILAIYILSFGIKLVAYYLSGFTAILADATHSVVDITMILILLASERVARKSPDSSHPLGHEMAKNVASLIVGVGFITFLSFELAKEGVSKVLNPTPLYQNIAIAISAEIIVLLLLFLAAYLSAKRTGILNRTLLIESVNDALSTFTAILGVGLVWIGHLIFDGVATLVIASIIFYNSFKLVRDNAKILLGLSPSDEFYDSVEKVCADIDGVEGVHDMVGVYTGENSIHLDLHVTVDEGMTVKDADRLSVEIAEAIMAKHPEVKHISVHFCPHDGERRKIYEA
ncbi:MULTISPECIES: cation diffusion facilitator family transporter [unclassified Archaeoglobus]|jgi:cation diffusion facilitator family transporter|uniref:cation diffusion facilitator family transporter n=1 Tax=unclassified Archaeoglobus TaxID=2643606 RepID=UPI0025BCA4BE|nr:MULTISPECIES: cation diffusion facilitator family transporter [unclassified Archaeoglobus]